MQYVKLNRDKFNSAYKFVRYAFYIYNFKSFNSESASTSANQSKMLMKENRDPRANRMTKICEHLV